MIRERATRHQLDGIAALLLFAVFAVCILAVLLTGADAYRRLTERDRDAHRERSCVQYISQRVHGADVDGWIETEDFEGVQALVLTTDSDPENDTTYVTRVYCYDGWLMELYSDRDTDLGPEAGERIMEAQSLTVTSDSEIMYIEATGIDGKTDRLFLSPRSREESK